MCKHSYTSRHTHIQHSPTHTYTHVHSHRIPLLWTQPKRLRSSPGLFFFPTLHRCPSGLLGIFYPGVTLRLFGPERGSRHPSVSAKSRSLLCPVQPTFIGKPRLHLLPVPRSDLRPSGFSSDPVPGRLHPPPDSTPVHLSLLPTSLLSVIPLLPTPRTTE